MRADLLVIGISIATLAVSVAALVLVLLLFVTEPWAESGNRGHTQELDVDTVQWLIMKHVLPLIESNGFSVGDQDIEAFPKLPGYDCFWGRTAIGADGTLVPEAWGSNDRLVTYNYIEKDDIWLVTSTAYGCKDNVETWTIDDNTGAITYGRLP